MTFDGLLTVAEINQRYKELFADNNCVIDRAAYWVLSDTHRRALETVSVETPKATTEHDPNAIHPRLLRNWAATEGIPLGKKGRVGRDVENAYRREHDLPLLPNMHKFTTDDVSATNAEIRIWARLNGVDVGERGRVNPSVIAAYAEAHA